MNAYQGKGHEFLSLRKFVQGKDSIVPVVETFLPDLTLSDHHPFPHLNKIFILLEHCIEVWGDHIEK